MMGRNAYFNGRSVVDLHCTHGLSYEFSIPLFFRGGHPVALIGIFARAAEIGLPLKTSRLMAQEWIKFFQPTPAEKTALSLILSAS